MISRMCFTLLWLAVLACQVATSFGQIDNTVDAHAPVRRFDVKNEASGGQPVNFLLITADDMTWDSAGFMGCPILDITPNLDRLASQGLVFEHGYVPTTVCMPSRHSMMTGRIPGKTGDFGDFNPIEPDVPTLPELLKDAGYRTGVIGKAWHMWPPEKFQWDTYVGGGHGRDDRLQTGRSPELYAKHVRRFLQDAKQNEQPFFLNVNSHDPHRMGEHWVETLPPERRDQFVITAKYDPKTIPLPGYLPDLPEVRQEMAYYFAAVNRLDRTVGDVLKVLEEEGYADDTCVMFLADHGMPFWFAKQDIYQHGTRVPWVVRWPGVVKPNTRDAVSMVSTIDYAPTVLEIAGLQSPEKIDGSSLLPVLQGAPDASRDHVFVIRYGGYQVDRSMAGIITRDSQYIFNPWSITGQASREGERYPSFAAIREAAKDDADVAARWQAMLYRPLEEFYELDHDPAELNNRIAEPDVQDRIEELRGLCLQELQKHQPQMAKALQQRSDDDAMNQYMGWYQGQRTRFAESTRRWMQSYRTRDGLGTKDIAQ